MKAYSVIISDAAEADLFAIYQFIAQRAGARIASRFIDTTSRPNAEPSETILGLDCALWDSVGAQPSCLKWTISRSKLSCTASTTQGEVLKMNRMMISPHQSASMCQIARLYLTSRQPALRGSAARFRRAHYLGKATQG